MQKPGNLQKPVVTGAMRKDGLCPKCGERFGHRSDCPNQPKAPEGDDGPRRG